MPDPKPRRGAYADIEKLPEHLVGELIDGELFVSPRPAFPHAPDEEPPASAGEPSAH